MTESSTGAQDPNELFDVLDANGRPIGEVKPRSAIHRDGDWHRGLHLWVAQSDPEPRLLFQLRGPDKDTHPNKLDCTVAGHYRSGETLIDVLREAEEEIGLRIDGPDHPDLHWLGTRRAAGERPGVRDFEIQDVYLVIDNRPLTDYRLHPDELAALVSFPIPDLLNLLAGTTQTITGLTITPTQPTPHQTHYHPTHFIQTLDRYFYRLTIATHHLLNGDPHVAI